MPLWLLAIIKISAWIGFGVLVISIVAGVIYNKRKRDKEMYDGTPKNKKKL